MLVSENLREFARFVREQELEAMIKGYLQLVFSYNIPLLKHVKHLSDEQVYEQSKEGIIEFLKGFEEGKALEISFGYGCFPIGE